MVITRLNDAILMVREMVKQKYEPMGIISPGSPGMYERQFFKALGKYADYCITNVPWFDPKQPLTKTFEAAFTKTYPDQFFDLDDRLLLRGHPGLRRRLQARGFDQAAGAGRGAARRPTSTSRLMIGGPITFDAKGQNVDLRSAAVQNLDGKPTVVLPAANAAAKPVFPMPAWSQRT